MKDKVTIQTNGEKKGVKMQSNNKYVQATRKMLYNYSNLATDLYIRQLELEHVRTNDGISSATYDDVGGMGGDNTSKVEKVGERNMMQAEELEEAISEIRLNIDRIDKVLEVLMDTEREVIEKRFISRNKKDWCIIAEDLGYSVRQAQRIEKQALTKITSLLFGTKSFVDLPLFNKELQG
ncbi:MAG TPA: DUF722 domain-containing protein [Epulopiscium sp.]|nr:DUF722 domain-containing protein [Candidatus Epulonipiscium sp.]